MGLRTVPVQCGPGSWGQSWSQDINKAALWNFLDPFPFSLIFPFFLLLPQPPFFLPLCGVLLAQVPSSDSEGVLIHLFTCQIFSEYLLCVLPCAGAQCTDLTTHIMGLRLEHLPAPLCQAPKVGRGVPIQLEEPWDRTQAGQQQRQVLTTLSPPHPGAATGDSGVLFPIFVTPHLVSNGVHVLNSSPPRIIPPCSSIGSSL